MTLLSIRNLTVEFPTRRKLFTAVDHADLSVEPGQIHGLVGESGAGKSTIGAAVMGLLESPGRIAAGEIYLRDDRISGLDAEAMRGLRGKKISMIFQEPLTSLNPLFTVREQLVETILAHLDATERQATERLFAAPQTDYTRSLLDLMPRLADLSMQGVEQERETRGR